VNYAVFQPRLLPYLPHFTNTNISSEMDFSTILIIVYSRNWFYFTSCEVSYDASAEDAPACLSTMGFNIHLLKTATKKATFLFSPAMLHFKSTEYDSFYLGGIK